MDFVTETILKFNSGYFRELETQLNVMLMNKDGDDLVISITNDYVRVFYERIRDSSTTALTKVFTDEILFRAVYSMVRC